VFRTVIPSKIFEAAAMEKPILLGVEGQAREIVERYGAGLAFVPEDAAAFRAAARRLIADPALARSLGQGGAALAAAYNRPMLAAQMLDVLRGVVRDARCST
jgi:glycosyltransferase involved in cell wall biosynthesis